MANAIVESLSPRGLWTAFGELVEIPRPSKSEAEVIRHIVDWAERNGFSHQVDAAGNLAVAVPASAGLENRPVVTLQSHVDIVASNADNCPAGVDAATGSIPIIRADCDETGHVESDTGDWIVAPLTTLGADNGIGVAAAIAVAEDPAITHGPLQLLFTVDEEEGLTGANQLDPSLLGDAKYMINLDSEDDDIFTVGCAGGLDTEITWRGDLEPPPANASTVSIEVSGLMGGHSGVEINRGRANAISVMARLLQMLGEDVPFRLVTLSGGDRRNAIPRSAVSTLLLAQEDVQRLHECCAALRQSLTMQFAGRDDGIMVECAVVAGEPLPHAFAADDSNQLASLLLAIPTGVVAMCPEISDLVETSNNLALITTRGDTIQIVCSSRSSSAPALEEMHCRLKSISSMAGATPVCAHSYSGWKPSFDSQILTVCTQAFRDTFDGAEPKVESIHAGLECGAILAKKPELEAISIGPTIRGNHAPGERVCISSVAKFYRLLARTLTLLAE